MDNSIAVDVVDGDVQTVRRWDAALSDGGADGLAARAIIRAALSA